MERTFMYVCFSYADKNKIKYKILTNGEELFKYTYMWNVFKINLFDCSPAIYWTKKHTGRLHVLSTVVIRIRLWDIFKRAKLFLSASISDEVAKMMYSIFYI